MSEGQVRWLAIAASVGWGNTAALSADEGSVLGIAVTAVSVGIWAITTTIAVRLLLRGECK